MNKNLNNFKALHIMEKNNLKNSKLIKLSFLSIDNNIYFNLKYLILFEIKVINQYKKREI